MSLHNVWQLVFGFLPGKPVSVQPVDENHWGQTLFTVFRAVKRPAWHDDFGLRIRSRFAV